MKTGTSIALGALLLSATAWSADDMKQFFSTQDLSFKVRIEVPASTKTVYFQGGSQVTAKALDGSKPWCEMELKATGEMKVFAPSDVIHLADAFATAAEVDNPESPFATAKVTGDPRIRSFTCWGDSIPLDSTIASGTFSQILEATKKAQVAGVSDGGRGMIRD
jgi:hypothetical protein